MQKRKISVFLLAIFLAFSCLFICSCKKENKKSSYTIQVKYLDGIIDGKLAYKFVNSYNSPFDCLKFNLYTNAYDENSSQKLVPQASQSKAYPYGESYGQITINSVLLKDEKIPFENAAEIGTQKVINEHSTIGLVVTTDGTITDIPRENYVKAEERVVSELKAINKPFIILLNSRDPNSRECKTLKNELEAKKGTFNNNVIAGIIARNKPIIAINSKPLYATKFI